MSAIRKVFVSFILALFLFLSAAPVYADSPPQYSGFTQADPEEQYYRGAFDVCMWGMSSARLTKAEAAATCLYFVKRAKAGEWYRLPSDGWKRIEERQSWGSGA